MEDGRDLVCATPTTLFGPDGRIYLEGPGADARRFYERLGYAAARMMTG